MRNISNAKIKKVMVSNYLFTLFFDNDVKIEIYKSYFGDSYPARSCVQVAKLPLGGLVEVECIACAE